MAADLSALGASRAYGQIAQPTPATSTGTGFGANVGEAATEFVRMFDQADQAVEQLARGEGSAQAVVEAMAQAELALQTVVTIRDRVVEAYQEILRMPL